MTQNREFEIPASTDSSRSVSNWLLTYCRHSKLFAYRADYTITKLVMIRISHLEYGLNQTYVLPTLGQERNIL